MKTASSTMRTLPLLICMTFLLSGCMRPSLVRIFGLDDTPPNTNTAKAKAPDKLQAQKRADAIKVAKAERLAAQQRRRLERDARIKRNLKTPDPAATVTITQNPPPADIWTRVRENMSLPQNANSRIDRERQWFSKRQDYVDRVVKRATPYLFFIVEEIDRRGLPTELALLPIVESAYQPFARSPSGAAGLWQFVRGTGKVYGLKQNWWYEGRQDVVASTHAALDYLQKLHAEFSNDWLLAIAAYNCGEGNVRKAIRKNRRLGKPIDFWSLQLPRETRVYVPRLLAVSQIVHAPEDYDLTLNPVANRPYFTSVKFETQVDLIAAATSAGMPLKEFYVLNPGFKRWASDPAGPHRILVPSDQAARVRASAARLGSQRTQQFGRYEIAKGDSLSTIATRYNTDVASLKSINNMKHNRIRTGRSMLVPTNIGRSEAAVALAKAQGVYRTDTRTYRVRPGDSLWRISRNLGTTVNRLAVLNGVNKSSVLRPGQRLRIPGLIAVAAASPKSKPAFLAASYTVQRGDSLWLIARRFQVRVADLRDWNQSLGKTLQPGQRLNVKPRPI